MWFDITDKFLKYIFDSAYQLVEWNQLYLGINTIGYEKNLYFLCNYSKIDQWYCLWLRALVKSEKNSFSRNQVNDLDFISAPSFPNILLSTFIKFVSRLVLFYFVDLFFIFFSLLDFHAALSQNPFLGLYCSWPYLPKDCPLNSLILLFCIFNKLIEKWAS